MAPGTLMCVVRFLLLPDHDAAAIRATLRDVALTSAYLEYDKPVMVMLEQTALGTAYQVKAYPFDMRDQFSFISNITVRGKLAIAEAGAVEVHAQMATQQDAS